MLRYCLMTTGIFDFADWLIDQLNRREWSKADLARRSHVDNGIISRIISRERKATPETLVSIAKGLNISPEEVFRAAGLLPPQPEVDALTRYAEWLLAQMPEEKRQQAINYIRFLAEDKSTNATSLGEAE